ncbi:MULTISPECIES: LysR family transcriptional regulator [Alphaproteobacteria]|uniref:LysR family transcriptional regulator n=1 Tax=Alphaproteobacteria TaxID=28211 RepID=UPI0011BF6720|nr:MULTISPECIES: LysR family transcriptional regulator [Alphaproteobacteria]
MHINRLDLNLFVVLDAIYAEGSVTRAAATLNLTQPAISHALRRLRQTFDDPLFVRQGSAMVPTPLARSLMAPVRQSLKTLQASVQGAKTFDPARAQRTFSLGCRDVLEAHILQPLMMRIARDAPGVEIASVRTERSELEADLASGALDLAIEVLAPVSDHVRRTLLTRDEILVVARADHPALRERLDLARYLAQDHVLVSSRRKGMGFEDVELARIGHQRHIVLRCQQYYAACRLVAETDLLLTMPGQYAHIVNRGLQTRIHPFPVPVPPLDVYLYWHENVTLDAGNHWLRTLLTELSAGEQPQPAETA